MNGIVAIWIEKKPWHYCRHSRHTWQCTSGSPKQSSDLPIRNTTAGRWKSQPAYVAMYERFPEAVERFTHSEHNSGEMEVGIRNPDTAMSLILRMYAYGDGISHMAVTCENRTTDHEEFVDGLFAVEFIKTTDCLERNG